MSVKSRSGHAIVEFALMSPWIFSLFVGSLNLGLLYASLTATENGSRAAAMHLSASPWATTDVAGACEAAMQEVRTLPNAQVPAGCEADPLRLAVVYSEGLAGDQSVRVTLTYTPTRLIALAPVPDSLVLSRTAEMRVRTE